MNSCPSRATEFLLSPGLIGGQHGPELGWVLMAFCDRHRDPVLDFVEPRVGPLGADAVVAEIAAMPAALASVGIDARPEGLDAPVASNVQWAHG